MEDSEAQELSQDSLGRAIESPPPLPSTATPRDSTVSSPGESGKCDTCGIALSSPRNEMPSFVYVLGRIIPKFPSESVEKEYRQAIAREGSEKSKARSKKDSLTEDETKKVLLTDPQYRYLARQMCWVLTVQGLETYILLPRDAADLGLLCDSLRDMPLPTDIDVVIGVRGPIAPPELCNGLMLPVVSIDQLYSFNVDALINSIPRPEKSTEKEFIKGATGLFQMIQQMTDNAGATDGYRALNYLTVRDPLIYHELWQKQEAGFLLTDAKVRPSRLTNLRKVMDVIFCYSHKQSGVVQKSMVRIDVTEEFPFIASELSPYYVYDQLP